VTHNGHSPYAGCLRVWLPKSEACLRRDQGSGRPSGTQRRTNEVVESRSYGLDSS